ncbi:pilus assembly protein PilM [Coraliomargarita akajimensis]|uniref:Fimbrial assembly family protein n=1 Tax=Coraliomargarita akajimensis (strain DSM 45221 / IAM 15411 / JCM 23193 / KCTC 12865 / 04OKA010-24) TaxID=583355 RepID=D5EKQ2_CORAD|nr:pilus assembly protein PilM [Coraliomargarita akajimensis]ADE54959.1 Fimbrial assembly family protein [Coraliomargarita akajimensis DSM 45221]
MSSSKRLIINCGASCVTAAVLSPSGGSLQVERFVTETLQYDYSDDDAWQNAVADALRSLTHTHKLSGKATLLLPGSQVLTRPIRIPHVEPAKRAQTIAFEAQQNIPFQLHEVVWDSQEVSDDGVETEVLFVACKSVVINEFCRTVASSGLIVERIGAATLLDYNSLQFAYGDDSADTLLINVGARSTNLLFAGEDGFFIRNIQIGGNTLTQSIADTLGCGFAKAEDVKHKFFAGDASFEGEDAGAKQLQSAGDAFMRRMSQEVTRSIVNYRRQRNGAAPKRILLSGRGAILRGLPEQLAASQKVDVDYFDPLLNVTLDGSIHEDPNVLRLQMGEIVGEACGHLIAGGASVNLLPASIQSEMAFAKKKPFLVAAALCLALAPLPAFMAFNAQASDLEAQISKVNADIAPLKQRQAQIQENADKAQQLSRAIAGVEGLMNSKTNWIEFFAELQDILYKAEDVWVDGLRVRRERPQGPGMRSSYELVIEGQMLVRGTANGQTVDESVLTSRIRRLQASFESSRFVVEAKPPVISWKTLRQGLNLLPFKINLVVDSAKPL